ncbi:MAG: hypothetical protein V4722_25545 [Bacteroidota bacterium]
MKKLLSLWIGLISGICLMAQSVGIGTTTPDPSAVLDINSSKKGALLPRMTTAERKAIEGPEPGLMVFDTDKRTIMIFEGTRWGQLVYRDSEQMTETISRIDTSGQSLDKLGTSVAISGEYAIAGSPYADNGANADQGAAIIFHRENGSWVQQAKIRASDGAAGDLFGFSVSISGDYVVVGAYQKDGTGTDTSRGAAYVFLRTGNSWTQQARIMASDGAANDHFGYSVGISVDNIIVGAPDDNVGAEADQGSVYFYHRNNTVWSQDIRLNSSGSGAYNHLGFSVSISSIYAIAGSPGNSAAYIFFRGIPTWSIVGGFIKFGAFGSSVSINGETAVVGNYAALNANGDVNVGLVYVFVRGNLGVWVEQAFIQNPANHEEDKFGFSVTVFGNTMLVGAPAGSAQPALPGTVYLYTKFGTTWGFTRKIDDSSPQSYGQFGKSVAMDGFNLIVGANINKGEVHFLNLE